MANNSNAIQPRDWRKERAWLKEVRRDLLNLHRKLVRRTLKGKKLTGKYPPTTVAAMREVNQRLNEVDKLLRKIGKLLGE